MDIKANKLWLKIIRFLIMYTFAIVCNNGESKWKYTKHPVEWNMEKGYYPVVKRIPEQSLVYLAGSFLGCRWCERLWPRAWTLSANQIIDLWETGVASEYNLTLYCFC